jgi:hypothetical protein
LVGHRVFLDYGPREPIARVVSIQPVAHHAPLSVLGAVPSCDVHPDLLKIGSDPLV